MTAPDAGRTSPELGERIRQRVAQHTCIRIDTLHVEVVAGRVVVGACVPTFYLKQLLLRGVLDALGPGGVDRLDFEVQVRPEIAN
jgi:hypothetical protein